MYQMAKAAVLHHFFFIHLQDFLEIELKRSHDELEKFNLVVESKEQQIQDLEEERDEERRQSTSYYNALEVCRYI